MTTAASDDLIRLRGARVHNLRNLDLDLPRGKLIVITGVSGSGKSSLAFDTLFAEGQRQFLETLSAQARRYVRQLERPDLDSLDGMPPTVAIDQRWATRSSRSTVGTLTEIHDYLRVLWARAGQAHCHQCGHPIGQQTPAEIAADLMRLPTGTKVMLLAPLVLGRAGAHREVFDAARKAGFVRVRVDGNVYDLDAQPSLDARRQHTIEAVVDRLVIRAGMESRLADSLQLSLRQNASLIRAACLEPGADPVAGWHDRSFSTQYSCPVCRQSYEEIEPRSFSFFSPYGACRTCGGSGRMDHLDPNSKVCEECGGTRLLPAARHVLLGGKSLPDFSVLAVADAAIFLRQLSLPTDLAVALAPVLAEVDSRVQFLMEVGLDYLTLDRAASTLSGGELQRVRLATAIGTGLAGACYVLDEPSLGLHPRDSQRLIKALSRLRKDENTLIVVEHDLDLIREADYLVDLGPGAGRDGGQVVAAGTVEQVAAAHNSLTGQYLAGSRHVATTRATRPAKSRDRCLRLQGATVHNLKHVTVDIPLGKLVCITGVSGSGKSSLVMDTLVPAIRQEKVGVEPLPGVYKRLDGAAQVERLVVVDQAPLGTNSRSTPATALGMFDEIRRVFARSREARLRGYTPARFSFNARAGRCQTCRGLGRRQIAMGFLPDVYVPCAICHGARYNPATLEVKFKGLSMAGVLGLRIDEAHEHFSAIPRVARLTGLAREVGLGYLTLGQPADTLSGGENQRIKLAAELGRVEGGQALYVLDEPTTGLHQEDVRRLVTLLDRLVELGHTVLVIEHHVDMMLAADWIIDLGPEGGAQGGRVLAAGTPEQIESLPENATAVALRQRRQLPHF